MSEPIRTIPYDNLQGLRQIIEYLLANLGKISLEEFDELDYIINKIDNRTIIIRDNEIRAAIDLNSNTKIIFEYANSNFPGVPTKTEVFDITTNALLEKNEVTINANGFITEVLKKNELDNPIQSTEYDYTTVGERSNISEVRVTEL